ncbi:MAG: hypothetical protein KME03_11535 [Aphanocapsa lilacina HA4352-LM1]|jgi:hypothetical protein|uniref:PepSY domain-containing protein n=1 Tax=Gloeobacter morelensis MG652769 TaxID=2781736 RepID=A0ABY3PJ06_9CYAN|nr:hypothetical protein [Gloeobacter morelensis]MBW4698501.1 hypothetical protein [Aphanocapsa lilacina HA4352-LM1]UFP93608.1 hypothetical protein ISF26_17725 [Gloeobacter morelensis MG652769]
MTFSEPPKPEQKEVANPAQEIQSQGEDLGYQLTPESLNTQPTPEDLLQAAAAYAQAAMGSGCDIRGFRQVSDSPETWEATVVNAGKTGVLVAKRVPGGYDLKVKSDTVQGIYD